MFNHSHVNSSKIKSVVHFRARGGKFSHHQDLFLQGCQGTRYVAGEIFQARQQGNDREVEGANIHAGIQAKGREPADCE